MTKRKAAVIDDKDVVVTRAFMPPAWGIWALVYMQVCAHSEVPPEQVERRANEENPSGTSGRWRIATSWPNEEPMLTDLSTQANPSRCLDENGEPTGRLHYMLSC